MSALPAYLQAFLPLALPFLVGLLTREIAVAGSKLIVYLRKSPKTAPLAEAVSAAEDVLDASVQAAATTYQQGGRGFLKAVEGAAVGALVKDRADLIVAAGAEIAALSGQGTGGVAVTDSGLSVNLPKIGS
jgi:hypothetical protein